MRTMTRKIAALAALAALGTPMLGVSSAHAAAALPPVQTSDHVQYLSGGVGKDEARAIEHASKHWPLALEFTVKNKQHTDFTADVKVVVHDAKGHAALQATAGGPFLLAKLAPGHYTVDATMAGETLHQKIVVKRGQPARAVLVWPAGTSDPHS